MSPEEEAITFGKDQVKVEYRLRQAACLLLNSFRVHFGVKARFFATERQLVSDDERYVLIWSLRQRPDQPIGYNNQQLREGHVRLSVLRSKMMALVARWESRGKKTWYELYQDTGGFTYKMDNGGGWLVQKSLEESIRYLESRIKMEGVKLKRVI